jgi:hypothetical protein
MRGNSTKAVMMAKENCEISSRNTNLKLFLSLQKLCQIISLLQQRII